MIDDIFEILSLSMTVFAFIFGAIKLLRKSAPLYFKLYVCSVGCYALEEFWVLINTFFGHYENMLSIRLVALFGCLCFMMTASERYLDGIVDTGQEDKRNKRIISFITPAVLVAIYIYFAVASKNVSVFVKALVLAVLMPAIVSSYYNTKHLIMSKESSAFLEGTKPVNAIVLIFFLVIFIYLIPQVSSSNFIRLEILDFCASVLFTLIIIFSERGARKWKTLP